MMRPVDDPNLIKQLDNIRLSQQNNNRQEVTDPELIKQLDVARMQQPDNNDSINLFQINPNNEYFKNRQSDISHMMTDPKEFGKSLMQATGILGSALAPELSVFKSMGMIPQAINALTRSGVSGGFGAMANPDNPVEGAVVGAAIPPVSRFITKTIPALIQKTTPERLGEYIQKGYGELKGKAEDLFQNVGKEAIDRGIHMLPIDPAFIRSLSTYLPKTNSIKQLLQKAESGEYEALRKLQADLFHRGNKGSNSVLSADRDMAEEMLEKRGQLNNFISDYFKNTGHEDLADQLSEAKFLYKKLQDIYHTKKLPKSIRNIYDPELMQIPPNLGNILSKNSLPLNKLIQENPLVASELEKGIAHQNALKTIKRLGIGAGLGSSGFIGSMVGDYVKNLFGSK